MHISNAHLRSEITYYQGQLASWRRYEQIRLAMKRPGARPQKPKPRPPEELGCMILSLCRHLAEKPCFAGYTYKEDLIGAAVIDCLQACERFNPVSTTSAFAYLTTTAWRRIVREIQREKKYGALKTDDGLREELVYLSTHR